MVRTVGSLKLDKMASKCSNGFHVNLIISGQFHFFRFVA
jgi:hypothetical protein